jgi:eukaryotic-like serine/threonine-protein kinase
MAKRVCAEILTAMTQSEKDSCLINRRKYLHRGAALAGIFAFVPGNVTALGGNAVTQVSPAQLQQLEGDWPKFRYDLGNTGFAATETGPESPISMRWSFQTDNIVISSPTVADGTVYVGSDDNNVYALDAETGDEQWRFETGLSIEYSSPAVANGTVYVGSWDGNVYALDAESGDELWRFEVIDLARSSPAVADGTVYTGSFDGTVYALDAETGEELWRFQTGDRMSSSPAVVDGTIYVGSFDNNVYALDAETGEELWRFQTGFWIESSPAVANGIVYIGSDDNHAYALDAETGEELWRFETDDVVTSSPAVADGTVYVGSHDDNVYALDAESGDELWRFQTGASVLSSPAVADGTVYVGSLDDNIYALDAESGDVLWRFQTGGWIFSSPAVADGTVYLGSFDNNVYALEGGPAEPEASITFSDQESDGNTVLIDQVDLSHGGLIEITDADGTVCGQSATLAAGIHENVEVTLSPVLKETQELTATVYRPTGEPYLDEGEPVSATALITVVEPVVPTVSITFDDQESNGTSVVIQRIELSVRGFVEITDTDGFARGRTGGLDAGTHETLEVGLSPPLRETQQLIATVYRDVDAPYLDDGEPVSATALITVRPEKESPKKKRREKKRADERTKREHEKYRKLCK